MSYPQAVLAALVVDVLLIDIASMLCLNINNSSFWEAIWQDALIISQAGLLGVWVVWGRKFLLVRLLLPLGVALSWNFAFKIRLGFDDSAIDGLFVSCITTTIACVVGLYLVRFMGWSVCIPVKTPPLDDSPTDPQRLQFSLANVISVTTCFAIFLGILRSLNVSWADLLIYGRISLSPVIDCLTTALALWSSLALRGLWFRIPLCLAIATALGYLHGYWMNQDFEWWIARLPANATLSILMLLVVRFAGYRFVRTKHPTATPLAVADGG